jgi:hypothetical protein
MRGDHGKAVAGLVRLADIEGDQRAAVPRDNVLTAGLDLADPVVAGRKLRRKSPVSTWFR